MCFNETELKGLYIADDLAAGVAALVAAAPNPVQVAAALIAAWLQAEKGAAEAVDQGAGDCFSLSWGALALGQPEAVIPSAQPVPPVPPGHHLEVGWLDSAGNISWNWRDDTADGGQWHQPFSIATSVPRADSPLAAISRYPSHLEVFWIDTAGNISSNWIDDHVDGGRWHQPATIAATGSRAASPLAAITRY